MDTSAQGVKWGKILDQNRCIGCHACTVACKQEHGVPLGVTRTYVKQVVVGAFPDSRNHFQVTRCNQCDEPPCVDACPTTAMFQRSDGIVDFDRDICIGCKACIAACPYDAIYIDPESHSAEKCNFCTSRIDVGLEPACVVVCPTQAILVGDLNDPDSTVSQILAREKGEVRRPEKKTVPKLFYVGDSTHTIDPLSSRIPRPNSAPDRLPWAQSQPGVLPGGSEVDSGKGKKSGIPSQSSAAAILVYDQPHRIPWDWRVSSYTWTKSIASGALLMSALLGILGISLSQRWETTTVVLATAFLGLTGLLLVLDLTHPMRFYYVLTRPQWRSWLVRGAYIISAYAVLLLVFFIASLAGWRDLIQVLRWVSLAITIPVAGYTAFLLGQSKGRDLWQSHLLLPAFLSHAVVAGSALLLILSTAVDLPEGGITRLQWALVLSTAIFLTLALGDLIYPHSTPHAALAVRNMTWGKYRSYYWTGITLAGVVPLVLIGMALAGSPDWTYIAASISALTGLLAYEHAYIQAGQSVPQS
ncbi:MAG: polysulfide reductase NrfD [Chloroflexi bacterium]|nr:polysulfide reductase NrfD [Chloroflexota bacterium]